MIRLLPYAVLLSAVVPFLALAQSDIEEIMTRIDHLEDMRLPGETGPPPKSAKGSGAKALMGRNVVKVTAIDPPAGFDPVGDANVPLGIPLNAALVRKTVNRLWESGLYSNVKVYARSMPGQGIELLIEVMPMLRVKSLEMSGNRVLKDDDVARAIEYTVDRTIRPDPEILRQLKEKLINVYSEKGYREAQAALRIETTASPGGVILVIEIEEGKPERYTNIRLVGLPEELDEESILRSANIEKGMPRNRRVIEDNVQHIENELSANGYLDGVIHQFEEQRLGRYRVELILPVTPGMKTQIEFVGNQYIRKSALRKQLFVDGVFRTSPTSVEQGIERVSAYCRSRGYFHVLVKAIRVCVSEGSPVKVQSVPQTCPVEASQQKILIDVREGPDVEVGKIEFVGNSNFKRDELETEVFAFVKEKIENTDAFQPFSTGTLDDMGLSDKRSDELGRPRGLKTSRRNQSRTYVPRVYLEAVEHLEEIYQEQGFLAVEIDDVCAIEKEKTKRWKREKYVPFLIARPGDEPRAEGGTPHGPCVFINQDRNQLIVRINVREGPQTKITKISFEGNHAFQALPLEEASSLEISDPYNEYRLEESRRDLESFYRENGYMFAEVEWEKSLFDDMKRAELTFSIREGPQVRVGRIRIEGAKTTSEKLILERLTLEPDELITPTKLEISQQRLMELGIFDSALVEMVSPERQSARKNIKVQIREGEFQYMELRGGMATVEGLRGGFEYGYRNIAGWAITARLRARANYRLFFLGDSPVIREFEEQFHSPEMDLMDRIEHHILIGLTQAHFPGTKGLIGWGIDGTRERVNEPAFGATRNMGFLRLNSTHNLGTKYVRALAVEGKTGIEDTELKLWASDEDDPVNPAYQAYLRLPEDQTVFSVTGLKVALDFRDHPLNPTKGIFLSVSGDYVTSIADFNSEYEWTALVPELEGQEVNTDTMSSAQLQQYLENDEILEHERKSNLIRAHATLSGYIPFSDKGAVLALSVSGGYIFHLSKDSRTWADRYFYVGGIDTLRGFPEESLLPEDVYQQWKAIVEDPLATQEIVQEANDELLAYSGGQVMLVLRAEFRYPIARSFLGALFAEAGNVWQDYDKVKLFDRSPLDIHLRPVIGGGLRYLTPVGLISFDIGINLIMRERAGEDRFAPFFSIGSAF